MFVGYTLSVLVMFQSYGATLYTGNPLPIVMPLLILSLPLLDTFSVMYIRIRSHRPLFKPDEAHLHHRLNKLRMNDVEAVLLLLLASFAIGINATLLYKSTMAESIVILIQATAIYMVLMTLVIIKERRLNGRLKAHGHLFAHLQIGSHEETIFDGIINDISKQGLSCCLLNMESRYLAEEYFIGKEMLLQILPAGKSFHGIKPFLEVTGIVLRQKVIAKNAVEVGIRFKEEIPESNERLNQLFYLRDPSAV